MNEAALEVMSFTRALAPSLSPHRISLCILIHHYAVDAAYSLFAMAIEPSCPFHHNRQELQPLLELVAKEIQVSSSQAPLAVFLGFRHVCTAAGSCCCCCLLFLPVFSRPRCV